MRRTSLFCIVDGEHTCDKKGDNAKYMKLDQIGKYYT